MTSQSLSHTPAPEFLTRIIQSYVHKLPVHVTSQLAVEARPNQLSLSVEAALCMAVTSSRHCA